MTPLCALVVEDEPANQDFLVRLISLAGFEVKGASTGEEALRYARELSCFTLVATDLQLPDVTDMDLVVQLRALQPEALLLVATVWSEPSKINSAFASGCDVFLVKPHGFMDLFKRLKKLPDGRDQLTRIIIDQYGCRPYSG